MTPSQLAAVQSTADVLISVGDQVAEVFYARLFELAPDVRPMFAADMERQKVKLIETLATLVNHVASRDMFAGYLGRLGHHHAGLGVMSGTTDQSQSRCSQPGKRARPAVHPGG